MERPAGLPRWAAAVIGLSVLATAAAHGQTAAPTIPPGSGGDSSRPAPAPRSERPEAPGLSGPPPAQDRGIIAPPSTGSDMPVIRPPATNSTPVIPPPGAPGGNPLVIPK